MQAQDVMTTELATIPPEMPVPEIAKLLLERRISAAPVVDPEGRLLGIVSEWDLVHQVGSGGQAKRLAWLDFLASPEERAHDYLKTHGRLARDVMTTPVITVGETAPVVEIARLLESHRIRLVPVVRDGRIVGIVSRSDLLRVLTVHPKLTAERREDDAIRDQLLARLAAAGLERRPYLNVAVTDGVVHLWGIVSSPDEAEAFGRIAQETEGVAGVDNHLAASETLLSSVE